MDRYEQKLSLLNVKSYQAYQQKRISHQTYNYLNQLLVTENRHHKKTKNCLMKIILISLTLFLCTGTIHASEPAERFYILYMHYGENIYCIDRIIRAQGDEDTRNIHQMNDIELPVEHGCKRYNPQTRTFTDLGVTGTQDDPR